MQNKTNHTDEVAGRETVIYERMASGNRKSQLAAAKYARLI